MSHYKQQFPTALRHPESETPCPASPDDKKHLWEKNMELQARKSPDGYEWEEHPWQCRHCRKTVWVPAGIELK
jgi:hypothetical protein